MLIDTQVIEQFGGVDALQARVDGFRKALDDHRLTVDVPAPTEDDLVERIARSGEAIEPRDPEDEPGEKGPSRIAELAAEIAALKAGLKSAKSIADINAAATVDVAAEAIVRP